MKDTTLLFRFGLLNGASESVAELVEIEVRNVGSIGQGRRVEPHGETGEPVSGEIAGTYVTYSQR